MMIKEDEISFVAKRFKKGSFSPEKGWSRLGIVRRSAWKRVRIAAAVAAVVVASASAALIYNYRYSAQNESDAVTAPVKPEEQLTSPVVRTIDFEDTPLTTVISSICDTYDVTINNIPENAGELTLSLHYEGTAEDLVETINDILGTEMNVERP